MSSSSEPAVPPVGLNPGKLTLEKENTYFVYVVLIAVGVWLCLALTLIGLVYAAFFGFILWLGNGLLVAYLRAEAVRVNEQQLPRLHATFLEVCARLGVRQIPALYVLQSGGMLNAFATKHAGRDFVVVYSDFLDALGPDSVEMKFILGHELGHIQSRHILKQLLLAPGLFFPLIGPAYRRSWESSCDRYGAYAADDTEGSLRAMLMLSGGREYGRNLDAAAFARQHADERGFFVSLHELTSTYPTLSRRVSDLLALRTGARVPAPRRHPLAYVLALGLPGGGPSAGSGLLVMVVIVALLAAMAIPAFTKVRENAQAQACAHQQGMLASALDQHYLEHKKEIETWEEVAGDGKILATMPVCPGGGDYSAERTETGYVVTCSVHSHTAEKAGASPEASSP
ncbi:MAG: M48 family metallopeptidase [Opitutaceae bacterium]|nr:M48 family metallopeptidase [Opitutaceae bacterium]